MKRCEITLPLNYNDGTAIEEEKFDITRNELLDKYKGLSFNPNWSGLWRHEGIDYEDKNAILQIECEDFDRDSLLAYKEILKERFQQEEIHIVISPDLSVI